MNDFARWVAKNRMLAKILFSVVLCGCYSMLLVLEVPVWIVIVVNCLTVFFVCLWADASSGKLLMEPLRMLSDQCDPYPLLEETALQLTYGFKGTMLQQLQINHALALRETGQYQRSWELLSSINIDHYNGTLPYVKFVYYCNLCDILTRLGRYPEADVWYQKAIQIYQAMPENKVKHQFREAVEGMAADAWFRRGEYDKALEYMKVRQPEKLSNRVDQALLCARCFIAMGDKDGARKPLEYVITNGNRLHAATQARFLLGNLSKPAEK